MTSPQKMESALAAEPKALSLRPITSTTSNRYHKTTRVHPSSMEIPPALFTASREPEPRYLPSLWTAQVHPEGQLYFSREGPQLRVVTDEYMYSARTAETVCHWAEVIEGLLSSAGVVVAPNVELFLQLEGEEGCAYYLVDHATYTQFWLEKSSTELLGLREVISTSHLQIVLEELYWTHVEFFPSHLPGLPADKLEELTSIFSFGLCDQMTSYTSTFPFPAQMCEGFLRLLQGRKGLKDSYTTCIVARLFSLIDNNKILTFHGQETARLNRDQEVVWNEKQHLGQGWISSVFSGITFRTSEIHRARLEDNFVDHVVQTERWAELVESGLEEWRTSAIWALAGLLLCLPLLGLRSLFPALAPVPAGLLAAALGSALFLDHRYRPMKAFSCTPAVEYLESVHSPKFRFQFLALSFALPRALQLWGFVLILINYLLVVKEHLGLNATLASLGFTTLLVLALYGPTSGEFSVEFWDKYGGFFQRKRADGAVQMV
ncbi:hypothetical protein C8R46DRAFT_127852 [Mycena filopes]|nr:hypothetical protein C8R46DRAFT_127852 [Mycena filopes]